MFRDLVHLFDRVFGSPVVRAVVPALVLLAAAWLIREELRKVALADIVGALRATPPWAVVASVAFTTASYACLAVLEWETLKLVGQPQPLVRTAGRSFVANALSGVVGFGAASGTALRIRLYASAKMAPAKIAKLVLIYSVANYVAGVVSMGLSGLVAIEPISAAVGTSAWVIAVVAAALITPGVLLYARFGRRRDGSVLGSRERLVALCAGVGDWVFSAAALFVLCSGDAGAFPAFFAVFCLGSLVGAIVGAPGGVGVLDATVLRLHVGSLVNATAAALILYRLIYLLGPAILGGAFFLTRRLARPRVG